MATGVLVCGVQRATKLLGHLPLEPKVYRGTVRLGANLGYLKFTDRPTWNPF